MSAEIILNFKLLSNALQFDYAQYEDAEAEFYKSVCSVELAATATRTAKASRLR